MDRKRFICTQETPWKPEMDWTGVDHPDAEYLDDCVEGCCARYRCPHCGKRFRNELPQ